MTKLGLLHLFLYLVYYVHIFSYLQSTYTFILIIFLLYIIPNTFFFCNITISIYRFSIFKIIFVLIIYQIHFSIYFLFFCVTQY